VYVYQLDEHSTREEEGVIRRCCTDDFESIYLIVNDAAPVYKGVIPRDCWKDPYMSRTELQREINEGVMFWAFEENGYLLGVMGIQDVKDVSLIRHAYVRTAKQKQGIGGRLLSYLRNQTVRPLLVGTWEAASWAIRFYENNGFRRLTVQAKDQLLREYWSISERQVETSVVLVDEKWIRRCKVKPEDVECRLQD
jgi:N-acetylglutamate synthase-like GNAT family acetyltransferase